MSNERSSLISPLEVAEQTLDGTLPYEESWRENAEAVVRLTAALAKAIEVITWCGLNDKTPKYGYGNGADAQRRGGSLPGPGKAFNTPREFASWWPDRLRAVIEGRTLDVE